MRVAFLGAPEFAVPTLKAIVAEGQTVVAAYTRAPKPGGRRGLEIKRTPLHEAAEALGIPVFTPATLRSEEAAIEFRSHGANVGLVIAYGLLLPEKILMAPALGCLNLHASLLPRWRGAAPIQRAIMAGDKETGVDLMRMDRGLDTGPVALRERTRIRPEDTAGDLAETLAEIAAKLAVLGLRSLQDGTLRFVAQSEFGITYARKIEKSESEVDWTLSAEQVRNHIHGLSPAPGAFSGLQIADKLERIKILRAEAVAASGVPGRILDSRMTVACGEGAVRIIEAQKPGRSKLPSEELMRRESIAAGASFTRFGEISSEPAAQI